MSRKKPPLGTSVVDGPWEQEAKVAARWWRDQMAKHPSVSEGMADIFYDILVVKIAKKISGHWYPEEPLRGQAFRSISLDTQAEVDRILIESANKSRINLKRCWPSKVQHLIMWVDPGEVVIRIYNDKSRAIEDVIFEKSYNSLAQHPMQTYSLSALTERLMDLDDDYDLFAGTSRPDGVSVRS